MSPTVSPAPPSAPPEPPPNLPSFSAAKVFALWAEALEASAKSRRRPKEERKSNWGWHEGFPKAVMDVCLPALLAAWESGEDEFDEKMHDVLNFYHFHLPYPHSSTVNPQVLLPMNLYYPAQRPPIPDNLSPEQEMARLEHLTKTNGVCSSPTTRLP